MKTDVDWRRTLEKQGWTIRDGKGEDGCMEFDAFIREVQRDALAAAIEACDMVAKANLDAQEDDLDSEELSEAHGAHDGAHDCAVLIRRLKDGPGPTAIGSDVPPGNNPAVKP